MARKASPRRPAPTRTTAPSVKPVYTKPRVVKPTPASEAAAAAQAGLLQLTFGRHAHGYGIVAAVAFVLNAVLLFNMYTSGAIGTPVPPQGYYPDYILWILPSALGAVASLDAIRIKREPYRKHYLSRHFVMSTLGMVLFFIVAAFIVVMINWNLFVEYRHWVYPIAVAGFSTAIISMAMTWEGLGAKKAGSILLAVVLPALVFALVLFNETIWSPEGQQFFLIVFLTGAVTTEISGSLLHIIASGTSVYQREILKADNTKVAILQQELQKKREALDYKERAIRGREAHLEALQQELDDQATELKTKLTDVAAREVAVERSTKELRELDRKIASAKAEIEARVEELKLRETDVHAGKAEIEKARQAVAAREAVLNEREKETKRFSIELTSQTRAAEERIKGLADREDRARTAEKQVDEKRTALLKLEKDLQLRESELRMKMEQAQATTSRVETVRVKELKDWESKILSKEKELGKLEVELRTLENQLKERYENATRIERRFQEQRKIFEDREAEMVSREKSVSDKEAALEDRSEEVERQTGSVREAQTKLEEQARRYSELLKDTKMKEAAAGSNAQDLRRQQATLEDREKKLASMQANLQAEIKRLNEENRGLLEKAKEMEARESELSLREMELEQSQREARAAAATPGMRDLDREAQLEEWERRLREREDEFKRRQYQKEKELEMREVAVKAQVATGVTETAEEAVAVEKRAEKVKTGNSRLDDLLYGGIPFNSNVLFVGPAFVGKEVAILNFVAEGLKKGVPAIVITTTKPPIDVARDMAPILPTFIQYEQLGLVRWIDATSTLPGGKPVQEKNVWRVNGPTDFENMLNLVNHLDEEFKAKYPYFRIAYLSLSSSITQADEREAMTFFQKLVNRLRQTKAVSAVSLERGMHADQTLEALEHMVDGALHFKLDKQRTFLQVAGLGEVQTRDWVPYKHTNKAIMIGSFQLERIR